MGSSGGPNFSLIHAADVHLGARRWLHTLPSDIGLRERLLAADRLAFTALVDLCIAERARFLLCAGDMIDGWCKESTVGLFLAEELLRLREVECEALIVLGNHDVRSRTLRSVLLPCAAALVGVYGPETRHFERFGLAVHAWSFSGLEAVTDVAEHFPAPLSGFVNIGLLHTSAEGCRGHIAYAPCSRRTLRSKGYDYWALGHVHARQVIATEPWLVFPGNLQGRGHREAGPKGATLVRVADGRIAAVEHRPVSRVRFETLQVGEPMLTHFDDVLAAARQAAQHAVLGASGCSLVVRLVVSGVESSAAVLRIPPRQRRTAFERALAGLPNASIFLDETWIDPGPWCGALRLDVAA